MNSSPSIDG
jgi:hypothetical protein